MVKQRQNHKSASCFIETVEDHERSPGYPDLKGINTGIVLADARELGKRKLEKPVTLVRVRSAVGLPNRFTP
jgi:hypothetical protein